MYFFEFRKQLEIATGGCTYQWQQTLHAITKSVYTQAQNIVYQSGGDNENKKHVLQAYQ